MMRVLIYTSIFTLVFGELEAEDWPQWLGTNRDAVWQETGIINTFDEYGRVYDYNFRCIVFQKTVNSIRI